MQTFAWRNIFSVGHEEIDSQHKQLFVIVNDLRNGLRQQDVAAELLENTVTALCAYTRQHFAEEESLLLAAAYPDLERHKRSHDHLIGKIEEFEVRFRGGETQLATELLPFLVGEWLSHHIAFEDQQYVPYLARYLTRERSLLRTSKSRSPQRLPG